MMGKRLFDLIGSATGLLLLSPLLVTVAILIKVTSTGPVFFRQVRVGRYEQPFRIFKFRTMRVNSSGMKITVGGDHRITRLGTILRQTKIDELPQLINVFWGDMSLVGPRPEVPEYVAYYSEDQKKDIFSVRPGITDRASLEFIDENDLLKTSADPEKTYIDVILPKKIGLYREYVAARSFASDLRIIYHTIVSILR